MSNKRRSTAGVKKSDQPQDDEAAAADTTAPDNVAATEEKRYQWPPPRDPNLRYREGSRNSVHSILTALPVLMLVAGLYLYFNNESRQTQGTMIASQSVEINGVYKGLSATSDRHYLWVNQGDAARGLRITELQAEVLESVERGTAMKIEAAPRVLNSNTYWVLYLEQSGKVLIDDSQLQN